MIKENKISEGEKKKNKENKMRKEPLELCLSTKAENVRMRAEEMFLIIVDSCTVANNDCNDQPNVWRERERKIT